jgi:pterin-4a-carbinolamine dehydratase
MNLFNVGEKEFYYKIKDLGRWEILEMIERYTKFLSFQDSLKFNKAPMG